MVYSLADARKVLKGKENLELGKYRHSLKNNLPIGGKNPLPKVPSNVTLDLIDEELNERTDAFNFFLRYDRGSH